MRVTLPHVAVLSAHSYPEAQGVGETSVLGPLAK